MSFLSKLGDFAGGFAEGLGEALPGAIEKGMDRRIDLMDQQRAWQRQDALRAEDREFSMAQAAYNEAVSAGDLSYLSGIDPEGPLGERAEHAIANIVAGAGAQITNAGRTSDVLINATALQFNDPSSRDLYSKGTTFDDFSDQSLQLNKQLNELINLRDNPNLAQAFDEAQIEALNINIANIEASIDTVDKKQELYGKFLQGKDENLNSFNSLLGMGDLTSAQNTLEALIDGDYISPMMAKRFSDSIIVQRMERAIVEGDFDKQSTILNESPPNLRQLLADKMNDAERALEGRNVEARATMSNWGMVADLEESVYANPNLTDPQKDQIINNLRTKQQAMAQNSIPRVSAAMKELRENIIRHDVQGKTYGAKTLNSMVMRALRQSPLSHGVYPWEVARFELQSDLFDSMNSNTPLEKAFVDHYTPQVVMGVMSQDELISKIDTSQVLTQREKNIALGQAERIKFDANTDPQAKIAAEQISQFTLGGISNSISDFDEEVIKRDFMAARGRPDPDAINRVKTNYTRLVETDIEHRVLTREQGEEILARIEDLILALTYVGPLPESGYTPPARPRASQAQQTGRKPLNPRGNRNQRPLPGEELGRQRREPTQQQKAMNFVGVGT